jgi:hypothetical protein
MAMLSIRTAKAAELRGGGGFTLQQGQQSDQPMKGALQAMTLRGARNT